MRRRSGLRTVPATVVGAVALLVAGGGYALAAGSSPKISVCVHRHGGGLYRAAHCAPHDSRLSWNVTGPTGPQGKTGANGAAAAYTASDSSSVALTTGTETILSKNLPAGNYVVSAKTSLSALATSSGDSTSDTCKLADGSVFDTADWSDTLTPFFLAYAATGTVTMDIVVASSTATTVTLSCTSVQQNGTMTVTAGNSQIDAIQVAAVH